MEHCVVVVSNFADFSYSWQRGPGSVLPFDCRIFLNRRVTGQSLEMPLVHPALTLKCSVFYGLRSGIRFYIFQEESLQLVAQNFPPDHIQAVSMRDPDGGLW